MNVYIYNADIYCEECGSKICEAIKNEGLAPNNPDDENTYDSGEYPKGPYADGGGEADQPQHCADCGEFLENPLTSEGYEYVKQLMQDNPTSEVGQQWANYYDIELDETESDFPQEPEPGDYMLTPSGHLGSRVSVSTHEEKFIGEFASTKNALEYIRGHMETEKYWPNIWWISDHGNGWQIDANGEEIKSS